MERQRFKPILAMRAANSDCVSARADPNNAEQSRRISEHQRSSDRRREQQPKSYRLMSHAKGSIVIRAVLLTGLALHLAPQAAGFGNEYVHIKVHVPKDQAPSIALDAEPSPPHKIIHHFHHHAPPHLRSRGRGPPKPKSSPLLESVILSDLDKPLHMSEHADYLNHAKELADHLSENYLAKKPPPPPKKKVNTYTIIEEKHPSYDYDPHSEHGLDTYRFIESRPQHHHHYQHHKHQLDDAAADDGGYHYPAPARTHRHKSSYHGSGYAEPAPVEEPQDLDQGYSYSPPTYAHIKAARPPAHTLEAPEDSPYAYDFHSSPGISSSSAAGNSISTSAFKPSPQLPPQPDSYADDIDAYAAPIQSRRRRPGGAADWPSHAAAETYSGADSYNVGHVQGVGSKGYQYPGPYL